jgi:hypothetical protein
MPTETPNIAVQPIQTVEEWEGNLGNVAHLAAVYSRPERLAGESVSLRTEEERLSQIELGPDSKSTSTDDDVVHAEEGFSPHSEHYCFNSRTHEKADFILNHVHLRIRKARYSYLFSLHVLDA